MKKILLTLLILITSLSLTAYAKSNYSYKVNQTPIQTQDNAQGAYVNEEITTPITKIAGSESKKNGAKFLNFNSPTIAEDLKKYLESNIDFPKSDVLSFTFSYDKNGTIASIHLVSVSGNDYYDGNDYYAARVYGDICKRDGLKENQIYIAQNSKMGNLTIDTIDNTNDGKYLVKIYDVIKNAGKSHIIEVPSYEQNANFNAIGGMYYEGKLYINQ